MKELQEVSRAVVFPWHCDHIGHMNVRWYAHFFDDGGFHLWTVHGLGQRQMHERGVYLVVANITINYMREMRAGDLLVIKGGFTKVGAKSVHHHMRMFNADTGALSATQDSVEVFFDPESRRAATMPQDIRAKLEDRVIALDD